MITKKGDITDVMVLVILLFVLATGFVILTFIIPEITGGLRTGGLNNTPEGVSALNQLDRFGSVTIQRGFFLLFVGLIIGVMMSSFFVRTHPIFLFLYIIILAITLLISPYLESGYETVLSNDALATVLVQQELINIVMQNLTMIALGVGALSLIIVFAKFSSARGEGGQL